MSVSDRRALFTIGELARRTGMSVRTIRFWSDEEVVPPTTRSSSGYRLYDVEAVARLDLVRTLRELGFDLTTVRRVLEQQVSIANIAAAHVQALDTEIRTLRAHRAVLRSVAQSGSTSEELRVMHKLAQLSAAERQRLIDGFVDEVFAGIDDSAPGAQIATGMRMLPSTLPDEPTPRQVDAWVELAELVADESFRERCREMALAGVNAQETAPDAPLTTPEDHAKAAEAYREAKAAEVEPESAEALRYLHRMIDPAMSQEDRKELADRTAMFSDRRVERYWTLLAILNGWPEREPFTPMMEWIIAALRAH